MGSGIRDLGCWVQGLGLWVYMLGFTFQGSGFGVWGFLDLELRAYGLWILFC